MMRKEHHQKWEHKTYEGILQLHITRNYRSDMHSAKGDNFVFSKLIMKSFLAAALFYCCTANVQTTTRMLISKRCKRQTIQSLKHAVSVTTEIYLFWELILWLC